MAYIDAFYVDTVNLQKLTEDAIIKALSESRSSFSLYHEGRSG